MPSYQYHNLEYLTGFFFGFFETYTIFTIFFFFKWILSEKSLIQILGFTIVYRKGEATAQLAARADKELYQAKINGRNLAVVKILSPLSRF